MRSFILLIKDDEDMGFREPKSQRWANNREGGGFQTRTQSVVLETRVGGGRAMGRSSAFYSHIGFPICKMVIKMSGVLLRGFKGEISPKQVRHMATASLLLLSAFPILSVLNDRREYKGL